ncbi:murein transglycosylase A [Sulfurimonas sp.]|uniref:murein transglycosylase A n=1 Tax=Sulfurimonas sp. TaxID=2022749 RepID=UPI002B481D44|nr:murein transglycosylase A [Sulfurimonas sp.]
MKRSLVLLAIVIFFVGCAKEEKSIFSIASFDELPRWQYENHQIALNSFINSCRSTKTQKIYLHLCQKATLSKNPKTFFETEFDVYRIQNLDANKKGLLTGYYEPTIRGSYIKREPYIYPVYNEPNDLISVDLTSVYPDLKNYRLRGRVEGKKLVPYHTREQIAKSGLDADIICYTDSKIDLFFLEVQGSGMVSFEDRKKIFVGFSNQNGHKYSSIGKYLVKEGEISSQTISLQSIKQWFIDNPSRIDEVLNYNKSVVFFKQKQHGASGSLGLVLTPQRSVAVDRRIIQLGSILFLDAIIDGKKVDKIVMAEDTGGAIKGEVRADMFFGSSSEASKIAGELKSELRLWILLPKENK